LLRLMREAASNPPSKPSVQAAVRDGISQSLRAGVSSVGDITRFPEWTREVLAASRMTGVSFGEVIAIGSRRAMLESRLEAAIDGRYATTDMRTGVSPHAPYTVEPNAMRTCAERAHGAGVPLCIHLAETREEQTFTARRDGPFVDYLRTLGVWDDEIPVWGLDPVSLAREVGLLSARTVIAHANYVSDDDIANLASSGASVAYCPRTHAAFGHEPHRFRDMLAARVNVCVGTDSLASNPSLSVLDELRFLHSEHPDVSPETLLRMGTINGAVALGCADAIGSLRAGSRADLAVIALSGTSSPDWAEMFRSGDAPMAVYVAGGRLEG